MIMLSKCKHFLCLFIVLVAINRAGAQQNDHRNFLREKIVAWCIVPFDSVNRTPEQRASMLKEIGITKLAYDWRDRHIPLFDRELNALNKNHIYLQAFWIWSGANVKDDHIVNTVFSFLKRRKVRTQLWYLYSPPPGFDNLSQEEKVKTVAVTVAEIAKRADSIGCTLGLYNHNGWFGEPVNQLEIINLLKMKNIGIVYNFNHAQDHIETFKNFFPGILPHLIALNLAGLKKGDQHIYPIGKGDSEQEMIKIVFNSSYKGPIGIINEETHPDAKTGLQMNMEGLKKILSSIGAGKIAATYP